MRVFVLNNYELDRVLNEVRSGAKPAHHLFGIDGFVTAGWQVEIVPRGPALLRRLGRLLSAVRWPVPLGDLGQQWVAWRRARREDVIYAPCQTQTQFLAYLRAVGLWHVPIVAIAHHPLETGRLAWLRRPFRRLELRGTDRFPALSQKVSEQLGRMSPNRPEYSSVLTWGADIAYYRRWRAEYPGEGVVAIGRTGRDWATLCRAAALSGCSTHIICLTQDIVGGLEAPPPNVKVTAATAEADQPYPQTIPIMARARVLAIPLYRGGALAGLTSLTDALALGKPVIMTRHPLIDLDIEACGIGRWIEPGDVTAWVRELKWFDQHPNEAAAMGRRAMEIATGGWNSAAFAAQVTAVLRAARTGS